MLITFSGMVGSGKSTASKHVLGRLEAAGVRCRYVRFQRLWSLPFRRATAPADGRQQTGRSGRLRGAGVRPRTLTAPTAFGYLARIVAFRLFLLRARSTACLVLDRFFYDSFVHYALRSRLERLYVAMLRRMMPTPDLPILLVASPATISLRRPDYAADYVETAARAYQELNTHFPELVIVSTESGEGLDRLDAMLRERLEQLNSVHR